MSRSRLAALVVLAAVAGTLPAYAAPKAKPKPKPVCFLIKDPANDASLGGAGATTYDPSLDIITADVNASATTLSAVIRVKDLTEDSTIGKSGRTWTFSMSNGANNIALAAYLSDRGGKAFGKGTGTFDFTKNEIRMHVPIKDLGGTKVVKGTILRGVYLTSNVVVGLPPELGRGPAFQPLSGAVDTTTPTNATFKVGTPSCVVVGK